MKTRTRSAVVIPLDILSRGISAQAKLVWMAILAHDHSNPHGPRDGICWPSPRLLSEETGLSLPRVLPALDELVRESLLVKSAVADIRKN